MAAISAVFLLRPARPRPAPARVVVGDRVASDDGLAGTVVRVDGAFALVDAGNSRHVWARRTELAEGGDGPGSLPGEVRQDGPPDVAPSPSPSWIPDAGGRLTAFGHGVWHARRSVVWGWVVVVLACVPLAGTAERAFTHGGFLIRDGEAVQVLAEIRDKFRMPVGQQVMLVPGSPKQVQAKLLEIGPQLQATDHVLAIAPPRPSKDGTRSAVTIFFDDTDNESADSYDRILQLFEGAFGEAGEDGVLVAGTTATFADTSTQTKRDLAKAELVGMPLAFLVLLFVFGGLVAASVPLLVGVASVIVTLALLHLLSLPLGLSIFVMNIASMLGFGLGIDYSLLGVSRFREELARGRSVHEATVVTVTTSGRAAAISGVAVIAGVAALAAIPLPVMFAIAVGGMVVVGVTVLASLTLLPAVLAMLGHRIERLRVRRTKPASDPTATGWYRIAHAVMRRPGLAIFGGIVVLALLASPTLGARLDVPHDDVLASDAPSVVAKRQLERDFGERVEAPVILVVDSAEREAVADVERAVIAVPHVERSEVLATDAERGRTLLYVHGDRQLDAGGEVAREATIGVQRAVAKLEVDVDVSGQGAGELEFLEVIRRGVPRTLALMFVSTILVLSVAFRSLTIPLKAVLLDTLSILASLGAVVAVFQDGVGIGALGAEPLGYTEATIPIILFCVLFGLSMDYEVFMLAKVTELYQEGLDDREATARGVAATAPLVTGAALILIVVGLAFATTELVLVKQIGFGMAVALALDATVVRMLLLPATMRWLGPANWWMPAMLRRRMPRFQWAH